MPKGRLADARCHSVKMGVNFIWGYGATVEFFGGGAVKIISKSGLMGSMLAASAFALGASYAQAADFTLSLSGDPTTFTELTLYCCGLKFA